ncbi:MAG: endopeptidase La, partial [Pseudomonadota bacterium]
IAILPLRNTVLFPGVVIPITAGRDKSIKLINDANAKGKIIGVVAQKDENVEEPTPNDIHHIGTVARIMRVLKMPDGNTTVILQGKKRFEIEAFTQEEPYLRATIKEVPEERPDAKNVEFKAIIESIKELAIQIIKESPSIPTEATFAIKNIESNPFLINFVSSNMNLSVEEKQQLLSIKNLKDRALETLRFMNLELQKLEVRNDIQSKVRFDLDQQQREYFLQQQMKTIQEELGGVSYEAEIEEMRAKGLQKKWDDKTAKHFEKELSKLQRTNPNSPDFGIQRNYIELFLELPWNEFTKDNFDLKRAQKILDRDHYGLEDVKKRIIEHLAVLKLRNDMKSPILCLYGPPGVGKTSIGKSVAEALGREYIRMSLGGLRDEAEIRGHRKTYIGAMPGRILQNIKKAKMSNPVFVLDEIDKLSLSHNGDPSSALLEVLDPEQNHTFQDHYVEVDYDLSDVMFVATSNSLNIPGPLLDRMEVIRLAGYTEDEKTHIAISYLLPKQIKGNGLKAGEIVVDESAIRDIIRYYTREAGVRALEREISKICRKVVKLLLLKKEAAPIKVDGSNLDKFLSVRRFDYGLAAKENQVGQVTGLAWTEVGGDLLTIEAAVMPGKGNTIRTGSLGDVMKESVEAARSVVRSRGRKLGITEESFEKKDIHIHFPEGATPKDGPSAGIAITTALVSVLTGIPVRADVAMTGEITLRGEVLPIGGLKEKLLAAHRGGIKLALIPEENIKDLTDIPDNVKNAIEIVPVRWIDKVLELALEKMPQALPELTAEEIAKAAEASKSAQASSGDVLKH